MTAIARPTASDDVIPAGVAWTWSIGSLGVQAMLTALPYFALFYLVTIVGLEPAVAGGLLFVGKLLDFLSYPSIGYLSDRTKTRFGRRRPYLLAGAILSAVGCYSLFNAPDWAAGIWALVYSCAAMTIYALGLATFTVPYMAMPAEMTDNDAERTRILGLRSYFTLAGIFAGGPITAYVLKEMGGARDAYETMGAWLGPFVGTSMLIAFWGARRAVATTANVGQEIDLAAVVRRFITNRLLFSMSLVHLLQIFAGSATQSVLLFFFAIVMNKGPDALTLYGGSIAVAGLVCIRIWVALGRRFGNLVCYLAGMWIYTTSVLSWVFVTENEPTWVFVLRALVAGVGSSASMVCGQAVLVGAIREDSRASGDPREGLMSSATSLSEKVSTAFGPLLVGLLLSAANFDRTKADIRDQPASAIMAIEVSLIWSALAVQILIQLIFWSFGYTRKAQTPAARPA